MGESIKDSESVFNGTVNKAAARRLRKRLLESIKTARALRIEIQRIVHDR